MVGGKALGLCRGQARHQLFLGNRCIASGTHGQRRGTRGCGFYDSLYLHGYRRGHRNRVEQELDTLLGLWRDLMLLAVGCADQVVNIDMSDRLAQLSGGWSLDQIRSGVSATHQALFDLSINVQPRLALDRMVTQWPRPIR